MAVKIYGSSCCEVYKVTRLRIESNIILDFSIDRYNSKVVSSVCMNENWDNENTLLYTILLQI